MEISGNRHTPATVSKRRAPVSHKRAGWVDIRVGLNSSVNSKISVSCGMEKQFLCR